MNYYYKNRNLENLKRSTIDKIIAPSSSSFITSYYLDNFNHISQYDLREFLISSIRKELRVSFETTRELLDNNFKKFFYTSNIGKKLFQLIYDTPDNLAKVLFITDGSFYKHRICIISGKLFIQLRENKNIMLEVRDDNIGVLETFNTIITRYDQIILQFPFDTKDKK